MSERRDEWVLVKSFGELFAGCAVRMKMQHLACTRVKTGTVLQFAPQIEAQLDEIPSVVDAWYTTLFCCGRPLVISADTIERGQVERLRPDEPAASDETATPANVRKPVSVWR